MCLAVPGKLISIDERSSPATGIVDFGGIRKRVCLELLPEARLGEYVIVHVGFALSVLDEKEALETLSMIREIEDRDTGGDSQLRSRTTP